MTPTTTILQPMTWVDDVYRKIGSNLLIVSALCGLTFYVIGLLISLTCSFEGTFCTTIPVYYGVFGISWVLGCIRWGSLRSPQMLDDVRICFKNEQQFVSFANDYMKGFGDRVGASSLSLIAFSVGLGAIIHGAFFAHDPGRIRLLSAPWYEGSVVTHVVILATIGVGCSAALGTGLWIFSRNARFLYGLRNFDVIPMPGVVIARFRRLTAFYLKVAFTWFVGVALLGLLFFKHVDLLSAIVLTVTAAFGLVTGLGPQFVFHRFIVMASSEVAGEFARVFKLDLSSRIDHSNLAGVTSMLQASQPVQMWVINLKDLLLLAGGQMLPVILLALKEKLGLHL
jgi:hypothetical protein